MAETLLALEGIAKIRDDRPVLRSVDLTVSPGELHLILGANGAGKSTLLRIIAGLLAPTAGTMHKAESLTVAYLGHATFLYPHLTALQNLRFQARINQIQCDDADLLELLEQAGLAAHAHSLARSFSRGTAQRLNFCRALLLKPQLFLMDEPFTGMDAASRQELRQELHRQCQNNCAVLLVSHDPQVDGAVATQRHILSGGRLQPGECPPC